MNDRSLRRRVHVDRTAEGGAPVPERYGRVPAAVQQQSVEAFATQVEPGLAAAARRHQAAQPAGPQSPQEAGTVPVALHPVSRHLPVEGPGTALLAALGQAGPLPGQSVLLVPARHELPRRPRARRGHLALALPALGPASLLQVDLHALSHRDAVPVRLQQRQGVQLGRLAAPFSCVVLFLPHSSPQQCPGVSVCPPDGTRTRQPQTTSDPTARIHHAVSCHITMPGGDQTIAAASHPFH